MDTTPHHKIIMAVKKILITGASGYVGQHLIASLAFDGLIIGSNSNSKSSPPTDIENRYELFCAYNTLPTFETDLNELLSTRALHPSIVSIRSIPNIDFSQTNYIDTIQKACNGTQIHAIVHLAALSSPGYCEKNASMAWKVNCPIELLKLNAPIIYMSTDQVYEGTKQYYVEDVDETVPVNVYGRTKLAFERVLLRTNDTNIDGQEQEQQPLLTEKELGGNEDSSCAQYMSDIQSKLIVDNKAVVAAADPNSVMLRSSLILGAPTPLQNGCKKGSFPSFLQFIESRLRGNQSTDYFVNEFRSVVHVNDVLLAIKHFLLNVLCSSMSCDDDLVRVFNLGGSTRASRYDIALAVSNQLKLDPSSANGVNRPVSGSGVPSPPDISMNVDKITAELGLMKMMGLKDIVSTTFHA